MNTLYILIPLENSSITTYGRRGNLCNNVKRFGVPEAEVLPLPLWRKSLKEVLDLDYIDYEHCHVARICTSYLGPVITGPLYSDN